MKSTTYRPPVLDWEHVSIGTQHSFPFELQGLGAGSATAVAWPVSNLAIYVPLYLKRGITVQQIWWLNGTVTASTSMECAVYNEAGTVKLVTSGVVTQAGNGAPQAVTINGGIYLPRGRYWIALIAGNNTTQFNRFTGAAALINLQKFLGTSEQTLGATSLPAAITFGTAAQAYIPVMGLSGLSLTI